jgi:Domain of unknown function (DUF4304)
MGRSASGPIIDSAIREGPAAWFRSRGFKRSGRSFWHTSGDVIHTANFQASLSNTPTRARFFVNLGVEWPPCYEAWTGSPVKRNPATAPVFVQARLHPTRGWGQDHLWGAVPSPKTAADEVVAALDLHALRFWVQFSDLAGVLDRLERGEPVPCGTVLPWLAHSVLLVHFGRKQDASRVLDQARSINPALIQNVTARLSLSAGA